MACLRAFLGSAAHATLKPALAPSHQYARWINRPRHRQISMTRPLQIPNQPVTNPDIPDATPWYLEHDPSTPQPLPTARQRLPALPDTPPPILEPLLSYVSDSGIDDLSLLDLRSLDPPAALGANLLMLIGTARSEKHVHVSADRLCRWLRTEYGLRPFADGLLGRSELRLKLRRKAKRSRLLGATGSLIRDARGDVDDGIRTGWVCVNLGRVDDGQPTKPGDTPVVGFGGEASGSRIVVQLLTEEKRGQLELEVLWKGILNRSMAQTDE